MRDDQYSRRKETEGTFNANRLQNLVQIEEFRHWPHHCLLSVLVLYGTRTMGRPRRTIERETIRITYAFSHNEASSINFSSVTKFHRFLLIVLDLESPSSV